MSSLSGSRAGGVRIPLHFEKEILPGDFTAPLDIEEAVPGFVISRVVLEVVTAFDAGQITVGDDAAQGRLMTAEQNDIQNAGVYIVETHVEYATQEMLRVYFVGNPTVGESVLRIYFQ